MAAGDTNVGFTPPRGIDAAPPDSAPFAGSVARVGIAKRAGRASNARARRFRFGESSRRKDTEHRAPRRSFCLRKPERPAYALHGCPSKSSSGEVSLNGEMVPWFAPAQEHLHRSPTAFLHQLVHFLSVISTLNQRS